MPTDLAPGSAPAAATPLFSGGALLDAEKLDVYRVAVEIQVIAARLLPRRGLATLRDQLDRASVSIVLNVVEAEWQSGAGILTGRLSREPEPEPRCPSGSGTVFMRR